MPFHAAEAAWASASTVADSFRVHKRRAAPSSLAISYCRQSCCVTASMRLRILPPSFLKQAVRKKKAKDREKEKRRRSRRRGTTGCTACLSCISLFSSAVWHAHVLDSREQRGKLKWIGGESVAPLTLPVFMMQVIKLNGALQFLFVSYLARLRMMPLLTMCSDKF